MQIYIHNPFKVLMAAVLALIVVLVYVGGPGAEKVQAQNIGAIQQPVSASSFTGTLPVSKGGTGTGTALTQGSVVFAGASGVYTQDNPAFQWDATNHCIAVGSGNSGCGSTSGALLVFRNTNGTVAVFQNTNAGNQLQFNVNNGTGAAILQNRNTANSANLPLQLQSQGGAVMLPAQPSTTGTRFICIDTTGTLVSSASACSGT